MKGFSDYPLLEREGELAVISTTLSHATKGAGSCLTLEGPAGVGKTRLLDHARSEAQDEGFRVLSARAGEREREYAWSVARSLFEPVLLSASAEEREALLEGAVEACRPLLEGGEMLTEGTPDSSFAIFNGLYALTRRVAAEEPVLLAVDDLHWVDGPSLGFLEFLARRIESQPIAVIGTLRPNEPGADVALIAALTAELNGSRLHPQPLTSEGSAEALRARLGDDADEALLREGHEVTGGNPLLLNELARTVEVEGRTGAVSGSLAELGSRAVGRTVDVRLSRAGERGRKLATAAAVLGEDSQLGHAIELAGLESEAADRAALDLVKLDVLRPGSRVHFVHPVIRAAVYESMPAPERERLHRRASELLAAASAPPERLAGHLLEVGPRGDRETVAILREAAVKAAAGGDSRGATVLMRRALAEPPADEDLVDVFTQLGAAELLVDGPSAVEHLQAAAARITEPSYLAAVAELLSRALMFQERMPEAIEVCERAKRAVAKSGDESLERRIDAVLIETTMIEPDRVGSDYLEGMRRLLDEATSEVGDDYGSRALVGLSAIIGARDLTMDADEAARRARLAAEGESLIREGMSGIAQLAPSQALALSGRFEESIRLLEESMHWHERFGSMFGHLSNLVFRARSHLFIGRLAEAAVDLEEALRLSRTYRILPGVAWSTALLAEAHIEIGAIENARAVIDEVVSAEERVPAGWHWINLYVSRGRLRLLSGDAEGALAELERGGELYAANGGIGTTWVSWRPPAVEAAVALGRRDRAVSLAEEELSLARRWGAPREIGRALRIQAAVDEDRREQLLAEAVEVLEPSEARLELGKALIELGACLRRANRKADSREPLKRGMDLAHECGAAGLADRARTELRASGVRARRTALSGPASLTESERRVVELAVEGKTNREIAAELFVTVKTVEVHLSNAYRKLEVKGRRQLAEAMATAA